MDLWSVHVKNTNSTTNRNPFITHKNPIHDRKMKNGCIKIKDMREFEIRVSRMKKNPHNSSSFVVKAMGKKNPHNSNSSSSSSSGDGDQSIPESNDTTTRKSLDWREFRALLYTNEQQGETTVSDTNKQEKPSSGSKSLPLKWAHPISAPENGCLLVATEKLDGVRTFERTVILLLSSGTKHPQGGPFGIVINRPLHKKLKHIKPSNLHLATTFADCSLHFGGPLEASMFLLSTGDNSVNISGFQEAIPGIRYGSRNNIDEAGRLISKDSVKARNFRFFFGYAGWQMEQLREEIESDYWYVAACSANLIFDISQNSSSESLWEEVLQLMGGHYSELSRKPKQDI